MDRTALRLERIRQTLEGKRFAIELHARIHIAVLAVSFTVMTSLGIAALTRQLDPPVALAGMVLPGIGLVLQVRGLRELAKEWTQECERARQATDILMASQGEDDHDA